jgi:hypothetical protein
MKSNLKPSTVAFPLTAPARETCPVAPLPLIAPLLTKTVSVHAGTQLAVADTSHVPSADPVVVRPSRVVSVIILFVARDLSLCEGASSSPPDTDLLVLPIVPPAEPACARARPAENPSASNPATAKTARVLDDFPISVTKNGLIGKIGPDHPITCFPQPATMDARLSLVHAGLVACQVFGAEASALRRAEI